MRWDDHACIYLILVPYEVLVVYKKTIMAVCQNIGMYWCVKLCSKRKKSSLSVYSSDIFSDY